MSDLVDNRSVKLAERIKATLHSTDSARFAVGYFFVSGLESVADALDGVRELRLLIGNSTNRETIDQLAEGYKRLEAVSQTLEDDESITRKLSRRRAEDTAHSIGTTLEVMDQTDEGQKLVELLVRLTNEKRLKVRVYTRGTMHAKAYIFDFKKLYDDQGNEVELSQPGEAIVGSSNFTLSGITSNTEMNVVVTGAENHAQLGEWFEELWDEAEDFDEALMREMKNSWAVAAPSPYDVYLKALYELVKDRLEGEQHTDVLAADEIVGKLADFQRVAFRQAVNIIKEHHGAFVADVVGLGKTYIGSAIVKYFEQTERARPLIICPKSLVEMWENYNERYELNARVLSQSQLIEDKDGKRNLLVDDPKYRDRDFVLVDESHNFRNEDIQRYRLLDEFLSVGGRKACLLTATPRNKSGWDVFNQLKLFQRQGNVTLPVDPLDLREYFRMVERGDRALPDLLANVLIRRTRNHVLRWYGRDAETDKPLDPNDFGAYQRGEKKAYVLVNGEKQFFPRRRLQTVEYSIEASYNGLYDELRSYLGQSQSAAEDPGGNGHGGSRNAKETLTYARYGVGDYVLPEKQNETRYRELRQAGGTLRGLMRVLLFKRFESSVDAFRETVKRLLAAHKGFMVAVEGGKLPAGKRAERILTSSDLGGDAESEEELLKALGESGDAETYDVADFDTARLVADIEQDIELLGKILALVEPITPDEDAKLQRLKEELAKPEVAEGKVLIFTQYADTARYLYDNINPVDGNGRRRDDIDVIFSGDKSKERAVGRFSPNSNPEYVPGPGDSPLSKLIATDVLSEGLNLQDCDKIINFDLHWNPVRLIQRFGRIDRIGTTFEEIYGYNFLPEIGIEENLGLKEKLQQRIREIQETIGEDGKILDPSEQVNHEALYAIYSADDGQQSLALFDEDGDEDDDLVDLSEAIEMFRQLREEDHGEFHRIASLRDGIRAARTRLAGSDAEGRAYVFCRAGEHRSFYAVDAAGEAKEISTQRFLGALRCEPTEVGLRTFPSGHNAAVSAAKKSFTQHLERVRAQQAGQSELPRSQRYAVKQLRELYGQLGSEERRERIERLEEVFRFETNMAARRELNEIHRARLTGDDLVEALERLYIKYRLRETTGDSRELRRRGEADLVARIVVSEAIGRA
jgi:superfamily II DNA or RNA helicase